MNRRPTIGKSLGSVSPAIPRMTIENDAWLPFLRSREPKTCQVLSPSRWAN